MRTFFLKRNDRCVQVVSKLRYEAGPLPLDLKQVASEFKKIAVKAKHNATLQRLAIIPRVDPPLKKLSLICEIGHFSHSESSVACEVIAFFSLFGSFTYVPNFEALDRGLQGGFCGHALSRVPAARAR